MISIHHRSLLEYPVCCSLGDQLGSGLDHIGWLYPSQLNHRHLPSLSTRPRGQKGLWEVELVHDERLDVFYQLTVDACLELLTTDFA
jgi:hypothetical protein